MAEPPVPRFRGRDLAAPTSFFLAALLIAAALAVGPVVGDRFRAVPLDVDQTWVADGADGARVLDRCSLDRPTARVLEAQVQQRRRVLVVRPSDSDVVTLQAGTSLGVDHYLLDGKSVKAKDVCGEQTLSATIDRVTLDRMTTAPTGPSEIQFDDTKGAVEIDDRSGRTYLFPPDADSLDYFDVTTRTTVPLHRVGTETIDGRTTTHFTATVDDVDLSALDPRAVITRPASWFGSFPSVAPDEPLTAVLHHSSVRDLFVDVATGVVVDERLRLSEEFRFTAERAAGSRELTDFRLVNIDATLIGDRQSRRDGAAAAAARQRSVTITTVVLPIVFGVLGACALAAGIHFSRRADTPTAR